MSWQLTWSSFAEGQIAKIHDYYLEEAGVKVAKKMATGIIKAPNVLRKNPELGQQEMALSELHTDYRYIIYKSFKIIYSVELSEKLIRIADVFDTRQNPNKLIRKK